MKIAVLIARILLGLVFLIFGLNIYLTFIPTPPPSGDVGAISGLMFAHHWFHFYGLLYLVAAVLLLVGRYVPVALVILGPILVNILLFHLTLAPCGDWTGVVLRVAGGVPDLCVLAGVPGDLHPEDGGGVGPG